MELFTFTLVYLAGVALFVFVMLFGESTLFAGTPIQTAHWVITSGICRGAEWVVVRLFGDKGQAAWDWWEDVWCNRPNPVLQLFYVSLLGGAYHFYCRDVFSLLPLPGLPAWHWQTGTVALLLCVATFCAASFSDPGRITPGNLRAHLKLYRYDGATCSKKTCWTCHFQRPPRSKHCPICGGCIARFDHHCGWVNNCVGLNNTRYFLAFLLANMLLCLYGCVLAGAVLVQDMRRRRVAQVRIIDPATGSIVLLGARWSLLARWAVAHHPTLLALLVFLAVGFGLVAAFFGYQLSLISHGMTTYETYKWDELRWQLQADAELRADDDVSSESAPGVQQQQQQQQQQWWRRLWSRTRQKQPQPKPLPRNMYNRGFRANLWEVLTPQQTVQKLRA